MNQCYVSMRKYVFRENRENLQFTKPAQNHTNGVKSKVCDEELARRNPVKKLAYLSRSRLIEDTLKPYIGIYQKHVLIPPCQR